MAHDRHGSFYTWNGGTLVLDPGVFTFDEPHLRMCHLEPVQATAIDRIVDPYEQRFCAKPMEFMSSKHAPIPIETAARCDTIVPGRSYCCPPYVMPNDWRVDYLPLGNSENEIEVDEMVQELEQSAEAVVQETGTAVQNAAVLVERAEPTFSSRIQENPILSVGIALLAGMALGRMMG